MSVLVVVPYSPTPGRGHAFDFVCARLRDDGYPLVWAAPDGESWCKAEAVDNAIALAHPKRLDVLVVHDADVIVDLPALREAVAMVELGVTGWAMPHTHVLRLSEAASAAMLAEMPMPERPELVRFPYVGIPGGGVVVLSRAVYDDCPLDHRFVGWGDEDQSWGWALGTLHGAPWRSGADLWHLWHPPAPGGQHSLSLVSNRLRRAYRAYRTDPEAMRALVASAR